MATALLATLLIASPVRARSAAAEWPSFRGPNGDGSVSSGASNPATQLAFRWKQSLGSAYSGIAVAGNVLVTAAARGDQDVVIGLSTDTGAELWSVPLGEAFLGRGGSLDGAISSPAISDGVAYALGPRGRLVAVEVASGKMLWQAEVATLNTDPPYYGLGTSPLVIGDLVLLQVGGGEGEVMAIERRSGEIAWRSAPGEVYVQSPRLMEVGGRTQVVFASNTKVGGLDPEEGTLLWQWPYEGRSAFALTTSPLVLEDGRIFFTPTDDRAVLLQPPPARAAGSVDQAPEAVVVWEGNLLNRTYSPSTVVGDSLVGYTSRFLGAYSIETGELLWRTRKPGDGFLIAVDDQIAVITKDGSLHLGNVTAQGYADVASQQLFQEVVWTTPSYARDAIYVRSMTEIARVDLVREGSPSRITDRGSANGLERPIPGALSALLEGDPAQLSDRVDSYLAGIDQTPVLKGGRALFLWRGEARDVGIAGDFLGMRAEAALQRLEGTDLWWYETPVESGLDYGYFFFIDYEPALDPKNERKEFNSVWGYNVNWVRGEPTEVSAFETPGREPAPAHHRKGFVPEREGRMAGVTLEAPEDSDERTRKALEQPFEVWLPPGYDEAPRRRYPTLYVFEWPFTRDPRAGRLIETLNATADRAYEAPIVVFVHRGLPGRPPSLRPLVEAVDAAFRTRPRADSRACMTQAFASLDCLEAVGHEPDLLGTFALQSFFGFAGDEVDLALTLVPDDAVSRVKGYLEWGSLEARSVSEGWDMAVSSRQVFEGLKAKGVAMSGGEIHATTDWKSWRNRTHIVLAYLFPLGEA